MRWGATGGEKLVRRITNSIRPVVTVSLLGNGEAQTFEKKKKEVYQAEGERNKAMIGSSGWLETEWQEGKVHESGIPDRGSDCIRSQSLHRSEETS